jgi:hypothetical protein
MHGESKWREFVPPEKRTRTIATHTPLGISNPANRVFFRGRRARPRSPDNRELTTDNFFQAISSNSAKVCGDSFN